MSEMCYIMKRFLNIRQIATALCLLQLPTVAAEMNRAYCGFQLFRGVFCKSVSFTVFRTRPKGVLS